MRSFQTQDNFSLSSVKPLDGLLPYRDHCLEATRKALQGGKRVRTACPICGERLAPAGNVEGLPYARCPQDGSLFLAELPEREAWARLLEEVRQFRNSSASFHAQITQSRADHVYGPKLEWIQDTLRLQELAHPTLLEVGSSSEDFRRLLRESGLFLQVQSISESEIGRGGSQAQVAVLLESLDRTDDPAGLLKSVSDRLAEGGLLFVTALLSTGFDFSVLGTRNLYLYPPDRANCFSREGLSKLLEQSGFVLQEVSTPGVLDLQIVRAHAQRDTALPLSVFEKNLVSSDLETQRAFQEFLQQRGLSSFARLVAKKGDGTA